MRIGQHYLTCRYNILNDIEDATSCSGHASMMRAIIVKQTKEMRLDATYCTNP